MFAYDTKYSQAVTHPSTNLAQCCLTSVIGRELVLSTWYGRRHLSMENVPYIKCKCINEEKMWSDLIAKRTSVQETTSYYHSFLSNMILFIAYYLFSIFLSYLYGLYENNV